MLNQKGDLLQRHFRFISRQSAGFLKDTKTERGVKNGNKQHAQREDLKKALSNMYPLVESGALIHDTGRQAGLVRLGFTKAIPSLTKAA